MKNIDTDLIEKAVIDFLIALNIGEHKTDIIKDTPKRVSKMCKEIFEGMQYTNEEIAEMFGKCFENNSRGNSLVLEKDIPIFSFCEHHLAIMYNMVVHVAYIPKGYVMGLSKIARIADMVGKRLQLQERIGDDIANIIEMIIKSNDVMVVVEGEHSCVSLRGIKKRGTKTRTITARGIFEENPQLRQEVLIDIGR